jgi:6-pyruvoyltetrahydropterin/6-carboxytetrahydropterin synthase
VKVSRTYTFPMGHRLMRHRGRCRWVHGHNWTALVEVEDQDGEPILWPDDRVDNGMVMDFGDLDAIVKPIIDQWDHGFMVEERDPFLRVLRDFASVNDPRIIVVPFTPTSENIAAELASRVTEHLTERRLARVAVSESGRSWAEWTKEDL